MEPRPTTRGLRTLLVLVAVLAIGMVTVLLVAVSSHDVRGAPRAVPPPPGGQPAATTSTTAAALHRVVVAYGDGVAPVAPATLVATVTHAAPRLVSPGGPVVGTVPAAWFGQPSILPVLAQRDGYLEVRLAQRPNGSTGWIRAGDATLSSTPFHIVVHLSTMHLDLYQQGRLVLVAPAGVGTARYPTPTGNFFVAFLAAPPSGGYGPFVMVTSGHSTAISDWEESGDALMAIHGPLGSDAQIGTTGAAVSHGCVRLHLRDLAALRTVPPGSPVDVVR